MKNKTIYTALLFILVPLFSWSQGVMTLEKAIAIGLENNFNLKISDKNIQVAEINNTWARAGKGPTVDVNGSFSNTLINDNNPASFLQGTYYAGSLGASVDANWLVYSGGRIQIAKDQLNLLVGQQELLRSQEVHNVIRAITQGYSEVIYQIERRTFLFEVFDLSRQRLAYENVRRDFGQSNLYNIIQFEDAITVDSINLINQDNQIIVAKRNLYQTLDLLGDQNYTFNESLQLSREEMDVEKLKKVLDEENYTLKTLSVLAQLDQLNTQLQNVAKKPTVNLSGSLGLAENAFKFFEDNPQTGDPFELQFSTRINGNVGVNANWNLYDGNLRKQNIQAAKVQEEITQLNILQAKAELYNQLDILLQNYTHQLNLLDLTEVQIRNARRNIEISEARLKASQITSLDYRAIQNQFLGAANSRINAIYNLIITRSEIDWLVGTFESKIK